MAKVFIGTSGFFYPHWGKGVFYPQDLPQPDWFLYYLRYFDTVELNVSFYRLPKKETFINWRKKAGPKFAFAVKGSRYITHIKRLKDCQEPIKTFFKNAKGIKRKNDVVLWQLPPRFKVNLERLSQFLKILPKNWRPRQTGQPRSTWRHAFEFRSSTWLTVKVYELLRKYNAAVVFQDNPGWPITEKITANFVYFRFHGKTHLYSSCYTENELKDWAKKIKNWQKKGLDCYAYFNNDALGYAVENAKTLKFLISNI